MLLPSYVNGPPYERKEYVSLLYVVPEAKGFII